MTCKNRK